MTHPAHKSFAEFARYLLVGGFNTVFGYSVFALLTWWFRNLGSFSYMYAWALGNVIAISVAFLAYKWFVFRTRGNYLAEWLRCFGVYSGGMIFGLVAMPVTVTILRRSLQKPEAAPYLAAALLTSVTILLSFLGHKNFSFRRETRTQPAEEDNRPAL